MGKISTQTKNGKAFEYSLLKSFEERLKSHTKIYVIENENLLKAKNYFDSFKIADQEIFNLNASFAVNFLIDLEPRLSNSINQNDILHLEIIPDRQGQLGDVRDVLAIRSLQNWEIGISAKNNHRAVKHSRLSNEIDFGEKWLGIKCSEQYFTEIKPIFEMLAELRKTSKSTKKWSSLGDYHTAVYIPILNSFKKELLKIDSENPGLVASKLVQYLIGNEDFYKVIKGKNKVEIQAYNLQGTLGQSFETIKPKFKVSKLKLPNRLIEIVYQDNSKTTLLVTLTDGWQISFRIHNASSRVEPSLKFDINLVSSPHTMFTNHLTLG